MNKPRPPDASVPPVLPPAKNLPGRLFSALIAVPAALWIFLEEWLWDFMLKVMAWLALLPPVRWLERQISRLPPYAALIAFVIPAAVLFPFKLAAFWLIAHGHSMLGAAVFIAAKIIGTAFLARIFSLTRNSLMTLGWFACAYNIINAWKARLYAYVRALPAYQRMRALLRAVKARIKSWWRSLFDTEI